MRCTVETFSFNLSVIVNIPAGETVGHTALPGEAIQSAVTKSFGILPRAHILPRELEFAHWLSSASGHREKAGAHDTAYNVKISGQHLQPGCIYILPSKSSAKTSDLHTEVPWEFLYNPDTHVYPPANAHNIMQTKFNLPGYMHKFATWHARKELYKNHTTPAERTYTNAHNQTLVNVPSHIGKDKDREEFGLHRFIELNMDALTNNTSREWGFVINKGDIVVSSKNIQTTPEVVLGCRNILYNIIRPTLIPDLKLSVEIPAARATKHGGVTVRLVFCLRGELKRYFMPATQEEIRDGGPDEHEVEDPTEDQGEETDEEV
jgi:hypothetical protein